MGYLTNLISSLSSQIDTAPNEATKLAIAMQLAIAQRAAGASGVRITVGYLADIRASLESQIDAVGVPQGTRDALVGQLALVQTASAAATGGGGSSSTAATIGDCKSGFQGADHGGWVVLNGRPISALATNQQTAATGLGIGTNIPDASGRVLAQGALGAQIGSSLITRSNLPNVVLTASDTSAGTPAGSIDIQGNHAHGLAGDLAIGSRGVASGTAYDCYSPQNFSGYRNSAMTQAIIAAAGSHNHGFTGSTLPVHRHTIPLGGSDTPYMPAAIGVNQFLYLGEPVFSP